MRSESVVISPIFLDDPGKLLRTDLLSPFKHHMFKHMGETCFSPCFIPGSNTIPDLEGDQRSLMVFKEDHLQAIGQDGFINLFFQPGL
jgi:hypothetical protein